MNKELKEYILMMLGAPIRSINEETQKFIESDLELTYRCWQAEQRIPQTGNPPHPHNQCAKYRAWLNEKIFKYQEVLCPLE